MPITAPFSLQILSGGGFPQLASKNEAVKLNTAAKDHLAGVVKNHPDRFSAFATLPCAQPAEVGITKPGSSCCG